jgi:hypothetical protein
VDRGGQKAGLIESDREKKEEEKTMSCSVGGHSSAKPILTNLNSLHQPEPASPSLTETHHWAATSPSTYMVGIGALPGR